MASRFVSGGTIAGDSQGEPPKPASASPPTAQSAQWNTEGSKKSVEWEAVQRELEADKRRREEARRVQVEGGGESQSLYDVLQANKAAKQTAFEEQNRIRNQFRALDDDEIDFLEGVFDERRMEEEKIKRETAERLASFREAQKTAGVVAEDVTDTKDDDASAVTWGGGAGKKRKRNEKEAKGIVKGVRRRTSEAEKKDVDATATIVAPCKAVETKTTSISKTEPPLAKYSPEKKSKLGLVDYGSDEDEDD